MLNILYIIILLNSLYLYIIIPAVVITVNIIF